MVIWAGPNSKITHVSEISTILKEKGKASKYSYKVKNNDIPFNKVSI